MRQQRFPMVPANMDQRIAVGSKDCDRQTAKQRFDTKSIKRALTTIENCRRGSRDSRKGEKAIVMTLDQVQRLHPRISQPVSRNALITAHKPALGANASASTTTPTLAPILFLMTLSKARRRVIRTWRLVRISTVLYIMSPRHRGNKIHFPRGNKTNKTGPSLYR